MGVGGAFRLPEYRIRRRCHEVTSSAELIAVHRLGHGRIDVTNSLEDLLDVHPESDTTDTKVCLARGGQLVPSSSGSSRTSISSGLCTPVTSGRLNVRRSILASRPCIYSKII
jgi:hypothetical protein